MRVLVCGGRDFNNYVFVYDALDELHEKEGPFTEVIVGGAPGADYWAESWAWMAGIQRRVYRADWKRHGKAAGPIRNQTMLALGAPHVVVAFPGGRGTADMVSRANRAGIKVIEVKEADNV